MNTNLTANETKVLDAVVRSAKGNGYDFGFTDEVVTALRSEMKPQAVGALLTSLQSKGQITVHGPVTVNQNSADAATYVQITLNPALYASLTGEVAR